MVKITSFPEPFDRFDMPMMMPLYNPVDQRHADRILFHIINADMNTTADQEFVKKFVFEEYIIDRIFTSDASISLTTAQGGIYTGAGKTGTAIVAATQAYSAMISTTDVLGLTLAESDRRTETPILSLTVAQGAASTADFFLFGWAL